ncbi:sensor histidine kinase [Nocardia australiensis]|uniref:sensor histidine kinase n=1 Tax=Nocardia australiensis TaxID=2887191 RepID=UPI001D1521F4|nr:ATP-binding protein [Nocardia australiensis]
MIRPRLNPAQWTVRGRSAVAAALVVSIGLALASGLVLLVLYRTLEQSARDDADGRSDQIARELPSEAPGNLDPSLTATDGQIGIVQVVNGDGNVVASSAGAPSTPLDRRTLAPSESVFLGRIQPDDDNDYWVSARGANSAAGPMTVFVGGDREPVEQVITTVAVLLAVGWPFVIALVALATYRLVGASLRPVERIRAQVASMSTGQLADRVPVPPTGDEIAHLAETMNDMLARLESGHLAQRRFVGDASHELRSPLTTIIAALELGDTRPDLIDTALIDGTLLPEARRMRELLEDLLLLARADEKGLAGRTIDVDIDDLLDAERLRLQGIPDRTVRTSIAPVRVIGDPQQLARMLRNLVDNAVRHACAEVMLACRTEGATAIIEVSDDGVGIPASERARVFERFVRLDTPRARERGGTGLGLAIVTEIVTAHRGTVFVTETDTGGALFVVTLPAESPGQFDVDSRR